MRSSIKSWKIQQYLQLLKTVFILIVCFFKHIIKWKFVMPGKDWISATFWSKSKIYCSFLMMFEIIMHLIDSCTLLLPARPKLSVLLAQYRGRVTWDPTSYTGQNISTSKKEGGGGGGAGFSKFYTNFARILPNIAQICTNFARISSKFCMNYYIGKIFGGGWHSAISLCFKIFNPLMSVSPL